MSGEMLISYLYANDNGESQFDTLKVPLQAFYSDYNGVRSRSERTVGAVRGDVIFARTPASYEHGYVNAPRRQLIVYLSGVIEVTSSAGETRVFRAGDLLVVEDTVGRGHISRSASESDRKCLFLPLGGLSLERALGYEATEEVISNVRP